MKPKQLNTQKIIESASDLFLLHGFGSVSMDQIAEKAELTKVTVYQHFESKDALLLDCLRWRLDNREAMLEARFGAPPHGPRHILEIFDWMGHNATRGKFHGCAFLKATSEMAAKIPQVRSIARQSKQLLRKRIVRMLEPAAAPALTNSETLADTLALLLEGAQALSLIEQSRRPFKAARREAESLLQPYLSHARQTAAPRLEN